MSVWVRFGPSPTGPLHLGSARTAPFNWLFARKHGGRFLLRIEDTDPERSSPRWESAIMSDLAWLGLSWDEAPVRQSERLDAYRSAAERLLAGGTAYYCFCTPEALEAQRQEQLARGLPPRYDGRCRAIPPDEARRRRSAGEPAAVVDDSWMSVTHVIRGDDHLANTPRQMALARTLELEPAMHAHLPLIHGQDGTPLSKRHGAATVEEHRRSAILPEALVNCLALLGWSPPAGQTEVMDLALLSQLFSLDRVSRSPARFDPERLSWFNRQHLRRLPVERLLPEVVAGVPGVEPAVVERALHARSSGRRRACARSLNRWAR